MLLFSKNYNSLRFSSNPLWSKFDQLEVSCWRSLPWEPHAVQGARRVVSAVLFSSLWTVPSAHVMGCVERKREWEEEQSDITASALWPLEPTLASRPATHMAFLIYQAVCS